MLLAQRVSLLFLWIIPLPLLSMAYQPGELRRYLLAGTVQGVLIGVAAWTMARRPDGIEQMGERWDAFVAPTLLISNWAVASLALNMNAPPIGQVWLVTQADQHVRYAALVTGSLLALAGLAMLTVRLLSAGERTLSVLGSTAAAVSALLFTLLFLPYPHVLTARFTHEAAFGFSPPWWPVFHNVFLTLQVPQRLLAYVAMILFAISLHRARLFRTTSSACLVTLTLLVALANVVVHIPPAVPLALPYLMGVMLMQRANPANGRGRGDSPERLSKIDQLT